MQKQPLLLTYLNLLPTAKIESTVTLPSDVPMWTSLPLELLTIISNHLDISSWKNFRLLCSKFRHATRESAKTTLPVVLKHKDIAHQIKTFLTSGRNKSKKSKRIQTRNSYYRAVVHTIAKLYGLYTKTIIDHSHYHINVNHHKYFAKYEKDNPYTPFSFVEISRIPFDEKRLVLGQEKTIFHNRGRRLYNSSDDY